MAILKRKRFFILFYIIFYTYYYYACDELDHVFAYYTLICQLVELYLQRFLKRISLLQAKVILKLFFYIFKCLCLATFALKPHSTVEQYLHTLFCDEDISESIILNQSTLQKIMNSDYCLVSIDSINYHYIYREHNPKLIQICSNTIFTRYVLIISKS